MAYLNNRLSLSILFSSALISQNGFANNESDLRKISRPQQIIEMLENLSPAESEELAQFVNDIASKQGMCSSNISEEDIDYKKMFDTIEEEETLSHFNKLVRSIDNSFVSPIAKIAFALYCLNYYYTKVTPWIKDNFKENEIVLTKITEAMAGIWFLQEFKDLAERVKGTVSTTLRGSLSTK